MDFIRDHETELQAFALRNAVTVLAQPFEYAKVLMQVCK
jgi:hypothetical protein